VYERDPARGRVKLVLGGNLKALVGCRQLRLHLDYPVGENKILFVSERPSPTEDSLSWRKPRQYVVTQDKQLTHQADNLLPRKNRVATPAKELLPVPQARDHDTDTVFASTRGKVARRFHQIRTKRAENLKLGAVPKHKRQLGVTALLQALHVNTGDSGTFWQLATLPRDFEPE